MLEWEETTEEEHEKLPQGKLKPEEQAWNQVFTALEAGKLVRLPFTDAKDRRGKRVALGRRGKRRGLSLEVREGEGYLSVRAVAQPSEEPAPRRRRRAQAGHDQVAE